MPFLKRSPFGKPSATRRLLRLLGPVVVVASTFYLGVTLLNGSSRSDDAADTSLSRKLKVVNPQDQSSLQRDVGTRTLSALNTPLTGADESLLKAQKQQTNTFAVDKEGEPSQHAMREREFTKIYRMNIWGSRESRSGGGSEFFYTANARRFMGLVFKLYNIRSWLDSPCGDCNWQHGIPGFNNTQYTGVDIVKDVIEDNKKKYEGRNNMRFFQVDLAADPLPRGDYDAILCRDVIQHLPTKAGLETYQTLETAGAKYLLTGFHSEAHENVDIPAGEFKYVDPMLPPFNFSEPIMYALEISDHYIKTKSGRNNYKMIGLWKLPALHQGTGQSITPINPAALNGKLIVNDRAALGLLKQEGFSNYECHRPETCAT